MKPAADPKTARLAALARAPGLGKQVARQLLDALGSPDAFATAGRRELLRAGAPTETARWLESPDPATLAGDLAWAGAPEHFLIGWGDPAYPPPLAALADAPAVLFVAGDPAALSRPQIAIVGSRNPTPGGREIAREFAAFLAGAGLGITSGLALGIDGAAHAGALDASGSTIAVMATGPERIYPRRHEELARQIVKSGALVTEFPPGTPPLPEYFPQRNRIVSGLALGTLVVEAALGSGSLITARLAADQGREVFALPGSVLSPLSRGCHRLIREGAMLVERPSDILEALGSALSEIRAAPGRTESQDAEPDPEYRILLEAIGFSPTTADLVAERTGLTPQAVSSMLLILELRGEIEALPGARYMRRRTGHLINE